MPKKLDDCMKTCIKSVSDSCLKQAHKDFFKGKVCKPCLAYCAKVAYALKKRENQYESDHELELEPDTQIDEVDTDEPRVKSKPIDIKKHAEWEKAVFEDFAQKAQKQKLIDTEEPNQLIDIDEPIVKRVKTPKPKKPKKKKIVEL